MIRLSGLMKNFLGPITGVCLIPLALVGCAQDANDAQSETQAVLRNLITVEGWVNDYQLRRPMPKSSPTNTQEYKSIYPRLDDLKKLLLKEKTIGSISESPIINPVTKMKEWPKETPHPIKDYRGIADDNKAVIGKGVVEFIPFVDNDVVVGYLIRAGDPATGVVISSNDSPIIRSNP